MIDDKKDVLFKTFSFSNSINNAESLICKLAPFKHDLEIGMEAVGHYWLILHSSLVENTLTIQVINPDRWFETKN